MDRLTAMQVFVEVAQSGSFSASADKLDMSRAMVTRYIGELENWLDARLLQRTTRSVTLTEAGEHCLRRSQQMLALMETSKKKPAAMMKIYAANYELRVASPLPTLRLPRQSLIF